MVTGQETIFYWRECRYVVGHAVVVEFFDGYVLFILVCACNYICMVV
jgi:hypothetical protein